MCWWAEFGGIYITPHGSGIIRYMLCYTISLGLLICGADVEESVVAKVLFALTSLCELGLFQKMRIWELMSATLGFLYHPNIWIRQGARDVFETRLSMLSLRLISGSRGFHCICCTTSSPK